VHEERETKGDEKEGAQGVYLGTDWCRKVLIIGRWSSRESIFPRRVGGGLWRGVEEKSDEGSF